MCPIPGNRQILLPEHSKWDHHITPTLEDPG